MTKKRKSKNGEWPPELKGAFPTKEIINRATKANPLPDTDDLDVYDDIERDVRRLTLVEVRTRVKLLVHFFATRWPENEDDWLALLFEACARLGAPGFRIEKAGAPRKRSDLKNRQLFADVMSFTTKNKGTTKLSENAAVKDIADHPEKYLNRYIKYKQKTVHRQFLRAKREFEQLEPMEYSGSFLPRTISRDEMIQKFIHFYSAKAELGRRRQVAQKSSTEKVA
jgi:hypothetical protein